MRKCDCFPHLSDKNPHIFNRTFEDKIKDLTDEELKIYDHDWHRILESSERTRDAINEEWQRRWEEKSQTLNRDGNK